MSDRCLDIAWISRYVNRVAQPEDALRVERHARACVRCHDKLHRMKRHAESLFDESPGAPQPAATCPSRIQLEHFARASLSERQLAHIQQHVGACTACLQRLFQLRWHVGQPQRLLLYRTRAADLDVRFTAHGLRLHAGASHVCWDGAATLTHRLGLLDLEPPSRNVIAAHRLGFTLAVPGGSVRGLLAISSPEAMRIGVDVEDAAGGAVGLQLWSRDRVWARLPVGSTADAGVLLAPGHYFVGPSELQDPWLALAVEEDLPAPAHLAELAYAHCAHGNIRAAVRCLDAIAGARIPGVRAMRELCSQFAHAHGGTIAARMLLPSAPQPAPPRNVHVVRIGPDPVGEIADLVRAVQRCVEHAATQTGAAAPAASRRGLLDPYAKFMRRMRQHLDSVIPRSCTPGVES